MEEKPRDEGSKGGVDKGEDSIRRQNLPTNRLGLLHVIVNPAAGQGQPVLNTINAVFQAVSLDWEVFITRKAGDARRLTRQALKAGADLVIAFGGDGTVMEAASGLIESQVPLAILPGGTGNAFAAEFGIPVNLAEACELAINPQAALLRVDIGEINGRYHFLLRASAGFEASMVQGANQELKRRLGSFAYIFSALQALSHPEMAHYRLTLDGLQIDTQGLTCILANSGSLGKAGISLLPDIDVSDGLLDVLVVRKADLPSLISLVTNVVTENEQRKNLLHWQAREIRLRSEPKQPVQVDGEILCSTPIRARVIPQAVGIIVPTVKRMNKPD